MILLSSFEEKKVGSTIGMKESVNTSSLLEVLLIYCLIYINFIYKFRVKNVLSQRIADLKNALKSVNMNKISEISIKESNQFHSICLDTFPPVFYLNEFSQIIIQLVFEMNKLLDKKVIYIKFFIYYILN